MPEESSNQPDIGKKLTFLIDGKKLLSKTLESAEIAEQAREEVECLFIQLSAFDNQPAKLTKTTMDDFALKIRTILCLPVTDEDFIFHRSFRQNGNGNRPVQMKKTDYQMLSRVGLR